MPSKRYRLKLATWIVVREVGEPSPRHINDPAGAAQNPPVLRAPNGILKDELAYYSAGKPLYDPSKITAPLMGHFAPFGRVMDPTGR